MTQGVKGLPSGAQVMRAASRAVRPLRVSGPPQHVVTELQLGVANPLVEGLVRLVEAPSLMETIEHLSSYHTRLSTSQGALDAEVWAVSQLIRHGFEVETYKFGTEGLYSANVIAKKTGTKYVMYTLHPRAIERMHRKDDGSTVHLPSVVTLWSMHTVLRRTAHPAHSTASHPCELPWTYHDSCTLCDFVLS